MLVQPKWRRRRSWVYFISTGLIGHPALSQTTTPPSSSDNDIIVTAPANEQQRADRHVYVVKDNAQAQTETGLQLMRHVPAVTVNSEEQVQLLGDPNVKVLIDGHSVSDGSRALKALPAGQIARIEIMTNPSAAYSAEGTAGVINVITRRTNAKTGLAGTITVTRSDFGGPIAKIAPTVSAGPWSAAFAFTIDNSRFRNDITQTRFGTDPAETFSMQRHNVATNNDFAAHAEVNYKPSASRVWTFTLDHQDDEDKNISTQSAISRGSSLFPLLRRTESRWGYYNDSGSLAYSWTGKRQGENLSLSATLTDTRLPTLDRISEDFGDASQTSVLQHASTTRSAEFKVDYVHPFARADILSVGGSVLRSHDTQLDALAATGDHVVSLPFGPEEIGGVWTTSAAYATLQFPVGGWSMLPGARLENRSVDAPQLGPNGPRGDLFFFPSLHLDRSLTKRLTLALSYSRRIEWPKLRQLDPLIHYYDPLNGESGNPALRPQLTDAFEASFGYKRGKQHVSLTLYDRETAHAWLDEVTLLANGVSLTSTQNIGSLRRLGGALSVQSSIGKHWYFNTSIDLLARRSTLFDSGRIFSDEQFTYDGNAQIAYQTKVDGTPGANHMELAAQYVGPKNSYQTRTSAYGVASLTWTHSFSTRLSSVIKLNNVLASDGASIEVLGAEYHQVTTSLDNGRRINASLVYRLGNIR